MEHAKLFQEILSHVEEIISLQEPLGTKLYQEFVQLHPADIATFLTSLGSKETMVQLFKVLPSGERLEVFAEFSHHMQTFLLSQLQDQDQIQLLRHVSADELTDLFDYFSDDELKKYLTLLNKGVRAKVVELLKFHPQSAGGIMDIDVLTFQESFTVEKSISLLQRLRPRKEVHQQVFVTTTDQKLVGFINLEDLVLQKPKTTIGHFMQKNELLVEATEDQESVAKKMRHYGMMNAPVVDKQKIFLGVISGETLVDVIVKEASEDIQKMASLAPMKNSYFETAFLRLLWERSYILIILLMAESFSSTILASFEATLSEFLIIFIPMLISAGGNTSSQTSAMVIQGMATGDISHANVSRFIKREFMMALFLALILGSVSFMRVSYTGGTLLESFAIGFSLATIVLLATILGSCLPFVLQMLRIDPAFSAGPFLATIMDVLGIFIFCYLTKLFLF